MGPWCFINTESSETYKGNVNVTVTGKVCQRWDAQQPHSHSMIAEDFPDRSLKDAANFCRDPGKLGITQWPWCYTMTSTRWEFCSVQDIICRKYKKEKLTEPDIYIPNPNPLNYIFKVVKFKSLAIC